MVDLKLEYLKLASGERCAILVDPQGFPDFWFTLFMMIVLRPRQQLNTIAKVLSALKHLRRWEVAHQRNLADEFYEGRFLEQADLYDLRDHCKYDGNAFESWSMQQRDLGSQSLARVASLNRTQQLQAVLSVTNNHRAQRMAYISEFLRFLAQTVIRVRPDMVAHMPKIDRMIEGFKDLTPKTRKHQSNSSVYRTPDKGVFEEYFKVAKPGSPDNPFKAYGRQLRHYIMAKLQYETGMRPGEVLGLWLKDIQYGEENWVEVVRRHDDPTDPRLKQEVAKTLPRVLPIASDLARLIHQYVIEVRGKISEAQTHPLLFVTHGYNGRGKPISSTAVIQEVGKIIATRPDTLAGLTRHIMRHGFALNLKEQAREQGIVKGADVTLVQSALGHSSPDSQDPYTQKDTQKVASRLIKQINEARDARVRKRKNGQNQD
jgi:integrase